MGLTWHTKCTYTCKGICTCVDVHSWHTGISCSLFIQVPVDDALQVLKEKLNDDRTLEEGTSIPVAQVMQLTELCLCSMYFQFENQFYEQTDGAAMGSPFSPNIANLFMEHIEEKAIISAPFQPMLTTHLSFGHMVRHH